jgi:hypothetical protein
LRTGLHILEIYIYHLVAGILLQLQSALLFVLINFGAMGTFNHQIIFRSQNNRPWAN